MKIIGVYQWENYVNIHIIEMILDEPPNGGDLSEIGQTTNPMMPWDPVILDDTGENIIPDDQDLNGDAHTRIAFFYHDLDFNEPLLTSLGPFELPSPTFFALEIESYHRLSRSR